MAKRHDIPCVVALVRRPRPERRTYPTCPHYAATGWRGWRWFSGFPSFPNLLCTVCTVCTVFPKVQLRNAVEKVSELAAHGAHGAHFGSLARTRQERNQHYGCLSGSLAGGCCSAMNCRHASALASAYASSAACCASARPASSSACRSAASRSSAKRASFTLRRALASRRASQCHGVSSCVATGQRRDAQRRTPTARVPCRTPWPSWRALHCPHTRP